MVTAGATGDTTRLVRGLRWVSLGRSERAAWGRCQGSAATPYETVVAADRPSTTSCSCPSRHRPCKHAVGLADLAADGQIADHRRTRLGRRHRRSAPLHPAHTGRRCLDRPQRGARRPGGGGPAGGSPAGQGRRRVWRSSSCGWAIRSGRGWPGCPAPATGTSTPSPPGWSTPRRPGWRPRCGRCPADLVTADWPGRALHALGGLHLLAHAHQQLDDLPEELAATVRSRVGYPVSKETVRGRPAVADRWWAIAGIDTVEYQLTTRRVWLRGLDTGRWAMWLTVAPPGRDLDLTIRPGRTYACAAQFYPGSGQYRALIEPPLPDPDLPPASDADPGRGRTDPAVGRRRPGDDRHPARRPAGRGPVGDPAAGGARRGAGAATAGRRSVAAAGRRWARRAAGRG